MSKYAVMLLCALAGLVVLGAGLAAHAQGFKIGPDGVVESLDPDPDRAKKAVEGLRKQGEKHAQDSLGASDDEWKVIGPKLEKVQATLTQLNASRGGIVIAATRPVEESEVAKRSKALVATLHNKDAKPQDLADALKAYREARSKAQEELDKARKDLKEILTARQEATLVTTGVLE